MAVTMPCGVTDGLTDTWIGNVLHFFQQCFQYAVDYVDPIFMSHRAIDFR